MKKHWIVLSILIPIVAIGYPWPLRPQNTQHSVTGVLDECREERDHFHDGIDIGDADYGTPIVAVADGYSYLCSDGVYVVNSQTFWYLHVSNRVYDTFIYEGDSLGICNSDHLHFGEGPDGSEVNPLRDGGISPFDDYDDPVIEDVYIIDDATGEVLDPSSVSSCFDVVVRARDVITNGGSNCGIYKVGYAIPKLSDFCGRGV